ncbi:MAG: polyprenyl synthetase family protein [Burkholderiales bacterium]|jgi:farnesyl diphosphate synthase|nr:polyprenyl synthetase family protein [Burkholderiales bacterium]
MILSPSKTVATDHALLLWQDTYRHRVDAAVQAALSDLEKTAYAPLLEAMRYAALGGKRWRALLLYATVASLDPDDTLKADAVADAPAAALELIHAYSLVHDDLPCMDNDAMRRGKPSCHIRFGETVALLAGDALQSAAFGLVAKSAMTDPAKACAILADAIGVGGMAGGQGIDMNASVHGQPRGNIDEALNALETMHRMKTGALIRASMALGMLCVPSPQCKPIARQNLMMFGDRLGLAFQIADDILDATASSDTLGKTAGKDEAQHKVTYVSLLGLEGAKRQLNLMKDELAALTQSLGGAALMLRALADTMLNRAQF